MANNPMDRRRFFRRGLAELIKPLADAIAPLENAAAHLGSMEDRLAKQQQKAPLKPTTRDNQPANAAGPTSINWLRPPGALDEPELAYTCVKSGECVRVCPVQAIAIDLTGRLGDGLPYINVMAQPCVMCSGLLCMHVCPTSAIVPTPISDVDMGLAVWNQSLCLRAKGEDCTICIEKCPIGETALTLRDGYIDVRPGCTGCGVCQHECPTVPKSILVTPRSARAGG